MHLLFLSVVEDYVYGTVCDCERGAPGQKTNLLIIPKCQVQKFSIINHREKKSFLGII